MKGDGFMDGWAWGFFTGVMAAAIVFAGVVTFVLGEL